MPIVKSLSREPAIMIPRIKQMAPIAIKDKQRSIHAALLFNARNTLLKIRPLEIGTIIILIILITQSRKTISTSVPAKTDISRGVMTGAIKVEHAVIVTERATLPFEI